MYNGKDIHSMEGVRSFKDDASNAFEAFALVVDYHLTDYARVERRLPLSHHFSDEARTRVGLRHT